MNKRITIKGWQVEFDWQGMTLTPPEQVDRYREVKLEAWMQAADAFTPGDWLFAPTPVKKTEKTTEGETGRTPSLSLNFSSNHNHAIFDRWQEGERLK